MPGAYPKFFGKVDQQGKLTMLRMDLVRRWLISLRGKSVEFIIRPEKRHRTTSQNNYYRGVVLYYACIGYQHDCKDETHRGFQSLFLSLPPKNGKGPTIIRSTADLSVEEFTEYIDRIIAYCAEDGIVIPDPDKIAMDNDFEINTED